MNKRAEAKSGRKKNHPKKAIARGVWGRDGPKNKKALGGGPSPQMGTPGEYVLFPVLVLRQALTM